MTLEINSDTKAITVTVTPENPREVALFEDFQKLPIRRGDIVGVHNTDNLSMLTIKFISHPVLEEKEAK